jgi:RNA polymerase sigma-B factor
VTDPDEQSTLERFREYRRTRDRKLRNVLVEEHAHLAQGCARRFARRSQPLDDLEQVALLGLLKAVERFDPERGPFAAYAIPTVLGELRRHFRDRGWMVRVPRRLQELHLRMDGLISELSQQLGRSPTTTELARAANVEEEDVLEAMEASQCYRPTSLDGAANGSQPPINVGALDADLATVEERAALAPLLERLPEREQHVLYLRYFEERTQAEIAATIGVSQMHVSRLISRSISTLARASQDARDPAG